MMAIVTCAFVLFLCSEVIQDLHSNQQTPPTVMHSPKSGRQEQWYTLDNRRLYCLQRMAVEQLSWDSWDANVFGFEALSRATSPFGA